MSEARMPSSDLSDQHLIELGVRISDSRIDQQNEIWIEHSNDKFDVAASLAIVMRELLRDAPADRQLDAISIGSSEEPQLRVLEAFCRDRLYLYDIDPEALAALDEEIERLMLLGVYTVQGDYNEDFRDPDTAKGVLGSKLGGDPFDLITMHHSLYYSSTATWPDLIASLYGEVLAPGGAMHLALMSASSEEEGSTTWLYNRFTRKYFGNGTDQDLLRLGGQLRERPGFEKARISTSTHQVQFWIDDFEKFMAVIWMIMLYPHGHDYSLEQRREITAFVVEKFWRPKRRLVQVQDYLSIFKPS
jgi:hypothetical protein